MAVVLTRVIVRQRCTALCLASARGHFCAQQQPASLSKAMMPRIPNFYPNTFIKIPPKCCLSTKAVDTKELEESECEESLLENLSDEEKRELRMIQIEYDLWKHAGTSLPVMTDKRWLQLLTWKTVSGRTRRYRVWLATEKDRAKRSAAAKAKPKQDSKDSVPFSYFPYNWIKASRSQYESNLIHAMMFSPKLVIDMAYGDVLTQLDYLSLKNQLRQAFGHNKKYPEPFHLHLTGVVPGSRSHKVVTEANLTDELLTITEDSYLEHYPREKLIYLSRCGRNVMREYDPTAVYIIGGLVQRGPKTPFAVGKAKSENIRCVRLPLDDHLR